VAGEPATAAHAHHPFLEQEPWRAIGIALVILEARIPQPILLGVLGGKGESILLPLRTRYLAMSNDVLQVTLVCVPLPDFESVAPEKRRDSIAVETSLPVNDADRLH